MILKGNQRGGGRQLAAHLMNVEDNEHVHVHEMRGFVADDLHSAFHEAYAVSRGTRAKQFLFSLSLNPPRNEKVSTQAFERAIDKIEQKLGLENQPRAVVFHEKEGRRHAHVVWSRIDVDEMKAINLAHTKLKLRDASKELFLEHGWQMPRGLMDSRERDPANFSHAEWQQAKRGGHDPKALKAMFQECWAISDGRNAFAQAMKARGYTLARGDRRGHVAVDFRGEVYAISKFVGVRAKDVKSKLGDAEQLASVAQAKREIADGMSAMLQRHIQKTEAELQQNAAVLAARRREVVQRQRVYRAELDQTQKTRQDAETQARAARFSRGFRGLWDRVTGKHAQIRRENEADTANAHQRDKAEKDRLIFSQLDERRMLHRQSRQMREQHAEKVAELHKDVAAYSAMKQEAPALRKEISREAAPPRPQQTPARDKGLDRDR